MAKDYTENQPVIESLQDALNEALGHGVITPGGPALRCTSTDQVCAVIGAAHLFEGRVKLDEPAPGVLCLDLSGLDSIRRIDTTSAVVNVEAAVTPAALEEALNADGLTLGARWFARPDAPLGQALARGEGTPLVISVGAVLPDGTLFQTPVAPRRATGPNPDALLVGSRGRLGVIVSATLRTVPLPNHSKTVAFTAAGGKMLEAVRLLYRQGMRPADVSLRKAARGRITATFELIRSGSLAQLESAMASIGAKPAEPDAAPPPDHRPRRYGWRRLAELAKGQKHTGLWIGPTDLHGGWVRIPGDAEPGDGWLSALRHRSDPLGTLRLSP